MKFIALPWDDEVQFVRTDLVRRVKTYTNPDGTMRMKTNDYRATRTRVYLNDDAANPLWVATDLWAHEVLALIGADVIWSDD